MHSMIAKYQIHARNLYQERCSAADTTLNTKTRLLAVHKCIFNKPTGKYTEIYEAQKTKRISKIVIVKMWMMQITV